MFLRFHPTCCRVVACIPLLCALLLMGANCIAQTDDDRPVVICVIDDFAGPDSHGERVSRMVEESSFHRCTLRKVDVNTRNAPIANGYFFGLRNVLTYAKEHPDRVVLVNISLGSYTRHVEEEATIRELHEAGVTIVAAAGNDDKADPFYPAAFDETLAVAATHNHRKASYSNFGDHIDIAAQGLEGVTISRHEPSTTTTPSEKIYYRIDGGTSFAAPRVTGLLGYLLNQRPELDPGQALALLKKHGTPVAATGLKGPLSRVLELNLFATLLHEDPLYQALLATQIGVFLALLLLFFVCDRERALFYLGLIFLGPLALGLNFALIIAMGLIQGSQAGIAGLFVLYLPFLAWFAIKRRQERMQAELELEAQAQTGPRPWGTRS